MKADWDKILKRGIIRKTVALHPIMDYYVRLTQSILVQQLAAEGIDVDVSYSVALNYMLLWIILAVSYGGNTHSQEVLDTLYSFLRDRRTLEELNLAEMQEKFLKRIREIKIKIREEVSSNE